MDEYKSMNYDFQPEEEPTEPIAKQPAEPAAEEPAQKTENYYQPFDPERFRQQETQQRTYYYPPSPPPKNQKKDRTALKLTALVAAVAIVASIGGVLLTKAIDGIKKPADDLAENPAAQMQQEQKPEEKPAEKPEAAPSRPESEPQYEVKEHQLPETLGSYNTGKSLSTVEVYELTVNSVVGIRTEATSNVFGQEAVSASAGSGFILSKDGYVITNAHVVSGAETIWVDMFSGESYNAELVGSDSSFDIAVLKVEAENLQPVSVGDSSKLKVGEGVVAIGNPLGELTFTMTNGILSALDREINLDGNPQNMLQTNAAINSGNSGGPLFDMDGNVIGVTSAKYSGSSTSGASIEGLGFAIPINTALKVAYDLAEYGYVRGQSYLGIIVSTLDSQTAKYYSLPVGPRVEQVSEGSCAETAGLQVGDIIIEFNGVKTETHPELLTALKKTQAGDTVNVKIYRAGAELELTVTLDEKPREEEVEAQEDAFRQQPQQGEEEPEVRTEPVPDGEEDDSYYYGFPFDFGFGN